MGSDRTTHLPRRGNPTQRSGPARRDPRGKESEMRRMLRRLRGDDGMNTAEYAVGTLAAVAFAGLLLKVLTSGTVQAALTAIINRALK
ncbi:hypothetical protein GCM10027605_69500 [Micromonospora zhanjiangensis]